MIVLKVNSKVSKNEYIPGNETMKLTNGYLSKNLKIVMSGVK